MKVQAQIDLLRNLFFHLYSWRGNNIIFWRSIRGELMGATLSATRVVCLGALLLCISCMGGNSTATTSTTANRAVGIGDVVMLTVEMYDNYYGDSDSNLTNPPVWTVQSSADVVATLTNHGRRNHNWAIVKQGVQIPVPYEEGQSGNIILHGIGMVYGNSQTTITFTAPEPGEYMVICTVSGHYPAMQGRLLVTASP